GLGLVSGIEYVEVGEVTKAFVSPGIVDARVGDKILTNQAGDYFIKSSDGIAQIPSTWDLTTNPNIALIKKGDPSQLPGKSEVGLGFTGGIKDYFTNNLGKNLISAAGIGLVTGGIGAMIGGKDGFKWGFVSGFVGVTAKQIATSIVGKGGAVFSIGKFKITPGLFGIGVGVAIFVLTYKKTSTEIVEFNCLPYQPPIGGRDCELCNENEMIGCSEYRCKSLGQACELLNAGTEQEACAWVNPRDVTSP
ncbi:unnamed protein product, partial [marine sediment metagenome]